MVLVPDTLSRCAQEVYEVSTKYSGGRRNKFPIVRKTMFSFTKMETLLVIGIN